MGVLQQARYIASNSGGSWFNGAMSYTQVRAAQPAAAAAAAELFFCPHCLCPFAAVLCSLCLQSAAQAVVHGVSYFPSLQYYIVLCC
jgi:hypothetical protein